MHGGDTCSKDFLMNNGSSVRTTSRAVESFAEQELQHVTSARATTCRLYISVWIWIEPEARSMFFCELQSLMSYVPLPYCLNGIMQRHKFDTNDLGMMLERKPIRMNCLFEISNCPNTYPLYISRCSQEGKPADKENVKQKHQQHKCHLCNAEAIAGWSVYSKCAEVTANSMVIYGCLKLLQRTRLKVRQKPCLCVLSSTQESLLWHHHNERAAACQVKHQGAWNKGPGHFRRPWALQTTSTQRWVPTWPFGVQQLF